MNLFYNYASLKSLARSDGWLALYDPSDAQHGSYVEDKCESLTDVLGNLAPLVVAGNAELPTWNPESFPGIGALLLEDKRGNYPRLSLEVPPELHGRTLFAMQLIQRNITGTAESGRRISSVEYGTDRSVIENSPAADFDVPVVESAVITFDRKKSSNFSAEVINRVQPHELVIHENTLNFPIFEQVDSDISRSLITLGPILLYLGMPSESIRLRMRSLLESLSRSSGITLLDNIQSSSAILVSTDHSIEFSKNQNELGYPASLTKMLTLYIARQYIEDSELDRDVQLTETDIFGTSRPELKCGDVVTYRDLFYLAALPSHNLATEIIADRVGSMLPGNGKSRTKFLDLMNDTVRNWGWKGAHFVTPSGLGIRNRATASQMAELILRIHDEDSLLISIMGTNNHTVHVLGKNQRDIIIKHTVISKRAGLFPEFRAGKSGTLNNITGNVAMLVEHAGEIKALVTMGSLPVNGRYSDCRLILDGKMNRQISRSPEITTAGNLLIQALADPDGLVRPELDLLYGERSPEKFDLKFPEADFSSPGSRFVVRRRSHTIELTVAAIRVPANFTVAGVIPPEFRPESFAYGSLTVRDQSAVRVVEVSINSTGRISFYGNFSDDLLRGSLIWMRND